MRVVLILSILLAAPAFKLGTTVEFSPTCTIIYSLQRSAQQYFVDEVSTLSEQMKRQRIHLIDLNNWFDDVPYLRISGRDRSLLREQYQLPVNANQAVVVDHQGNEVSRLTGSVTLVNALLSCPA